ncbi:MAG: HAD hydrolase-like protein [Chromatiales bacterium]|jgi:phosphoglycolate phosphatase
MYSKDQLVILDADGTTIDAFSAIERTFACHNMNIGDLERFQKRRHLFKYLGGIKEFPKNLKQQLGKQQRAKLISTLTEIYREEARLYEDIVPLVKSLLGRNGLRVGLITRNITNTPTDTLRCLFQRHGIEIKELDFLIHIPLKQAKLQHFREVRNRYRINPARAYACGDEKKDFEAAIGSGCHPFMVSYGFEDFERLTKKVGVPPEIISRSPLELHDRISHTLDF